MKPAMTLKHEPSYKVGHVRRVLTHDSVRDLLPKFVRIMKRFEFDVIAFRGMSGCLLAAPLSYLTGKPLIMVRKPNDGSHSGMRVEGDYAAKSYIIVDDFVSTGNTARKLIKAITEWPWPETAPKCVGILCADEVNNYFEGNPRNRKEFTLEQVKL